MQSLDVHWHAKPLKSQPNKKRQRWKKTANLVNTCQLRKHLLLRLQVRPLGLSTHLSARSANASVPQIQLRRSDLITGAERLDQGA